MKIKDSVALVRGASSGIGIATEERPAEARYNGYGTSRLGAQEVRTSSAGHAAAEADRHRLLNIPAAYAEPIARTGVPGFPAAAWFRSADSMGAAFTPILLFSCQRSQ